MDRWVLYSPPPPPIIFVTIDLPLTIPNLDIHSLYAFKTSTNANLTVVLASVLHLFCMANYPVSWFWQDEESSEEYALPRYSDLFNGTWILHNDSSNYFSNNIPTGIRKSYYPLVMISPVIESMPKIYKCRANNLTGLNYATTARLLIDTNTGYIDSDPRILLGVFDRFAPAVLTPILDQSDVDFLCFLPPGSEDTVRLIMPDGTKIDVPQPHKISSVSGVIVSRTRIAGSLFWNLNVVFMIAPKGLYTLTIDARANYSFEYVRPMYQTVSLRKKNEHFFGTAYLGEIYEARLFVEETFDTGEVELFSQNYENECQTYPVPANNASAVCGILVLQAFRNLSDDRNGIAVIVNATRSCSILVRLMNNTGNLKSVESFLHLTVWEKVFSGSELIVARGYLGNENNFIRSGKVIPSNETLTLRCVFPVCTFEKVYLCKIDPPSSLSNRIEGCVIKETIEESRATYTENFVFILKKGTKPQLHLLSNYTLAIDVRFYAITKTDSGFYYCGGKYKEKVSGDSFVLKVEDPSPPRIREGNPGQIFERWIENGHDTTLTCDVDGFPDPELFWYEEDGSGSKMMMEKYFSKTSISVNKSGTFICVSKNKVGRDERKFRVKYNIPVTTIIAAIVPTIIIITLAIAIVYFWHRQHTKLRLLKRFNALFDDPIDHVAIDSDRPLNDQADVLSFEQKYEINRDQFVLTKEIGHGQFGRVFKGELSFNTADDNKLTVAIKSPKDPENLDQYKDLLSEYKIMTQIRPHVNIVSLLGVCKFVEGKNFFLYVLTEFCGHGSLEDYLIKHWSVFESFSDAAGTSDLMEGSTTLLGYAYQAAKGMRHLALHKGSVRIDRHSVDWIVKKGIESFQEALKRHEDLLKMKMPLLGPATRAEPM